MKIAEIDSKPHVYLDASDLKSLKDYDVGDTYYALYKCKMLSKTEDKDGVHGSFEILEIKAVPHPDVSKVKELIKK